MWDMAKQAAIQGSGLPRVHPRSMGSSCQLGGIVALYSGVAGLKGKAENDEGVGSQWAGGLLVALALSIFLLWS